MKRLFEKAAPGRSTDAVFWWVAFGIISTVVVYGVLVLTTAKLSVSVDLGKTGTFGDSFGVLTSLFSGLAFAGVIWTILQQREELKEARRQDVITRLSTVTQNQISSYRSEIAELKFTSLTDGSEVGPHAMAASLEAHLERLVLDQDSGRLTGQEHRSRVEKALKSILGELSQHGRLVEGLRRCCRSNRYMLSNEILNVEDAQDLHALMLAEIPAGLFKYAKNARTVLTLYEQHVMPKEGLQMLFDPVRDVLQHLDEVIEHNSLGITSKMLVEDRTHRYIFRQQH